MVSACSAVSTRTIDSAPRRSSLDLLVASVADEEDRVAEPGVVPRLGVHLRDQRARGVDRPQPAEARAVATAGETPCAEKTTRLRRHLGDAVDEDGSAALEVADDVGVVDDLLAHIDRRPVQLESLLHGLDGRSTPAQ